MSDSKIDLIIIGAGIAGLSAARDAAQSGLTVVSLEALLFGGLIVNVNELDPAPSGEYLSGTDLASKLMEEIAELGVESVSETVTALARDGDLLSVASDSGTRRARALIVATGAKLKRLGIPGEVEFEYRGVSQCADCDGPMYKDEEVVVVGGGDSALQEALVLAQFCKRVHLVHRGATFRARQQLIDAVAAHDNIRPLWNAVAEEVLGAQTVERVRVRDVGNGQRSEIPCAGFFAYVGLEPNCDFVPAEVERDEQGALLTDAALQTAIPGLFAAGAVRAGYGGLLTHALGDGRAAAKSVRTLLGG
jgi:thioredoxin reductase (NADPH)